MAGISVNLPGKSTVNLPDAPKATSGHSTGMSDKLLLANIERLLKARNVSANAISTIAGSPDAIRNLRRRVAGGKTGSWNLDTLSAVAEALETTPWELLRPPGARDHEAIREIVREVLAEEATSPAKRSRTR